MYAHTISFRTVLIIYLVIPATLSLLQSGGGRAGGYNTRGGLSSQTGGYNTRGGAHGSGELQLPVFLLLPMVQLSVPFQY